MTRLSLALVLVFGLTGSAAGSEDGDAMLADAAERGDAALVRTLLNADGDVDVDSAQVDGMTALHWAVYRDDADTARLLVQAGADVGVENRYGVSPLALAATNGNGALVRLLLESGADANASLHGGESVLMTAARTGSVEAVDALLVGGADPNARERRNQTALMWAAAEGHAPIVSALIEAGADIHASLESGFTPMFFAVREGRIEVADTLLGAGVDVNGLLQRVLEEPDRPVNNDSYRPVDDGMSPLLMAVRNGHFELAIELVKAGGRSERPAHRLHAASHDELGTEARCQRPGGSTADWVGRRNEPRVRSRAGGVGRGCERPPRRRCSPPTAYRVECREGGRHAIPYGRRSGRCRADACLRRAGRRPVLAQRPEHDPPDGGGGPRHDGAAGGIWNRPRSSGGGAAAAGARCEESTR